MKHTKIITSLLLAGAFVFSSSLMAADDAKKGKKKGKKAAAGEQAKGKRQNPLMNLTGLTADQKTELKAFQKNFGAKMKEAGKDKEKRSALNKERVAALKEILTEDQQKELKEKQMAARKAAKAKGGEKGKGKKKKDA